MAEAKEQSDRSVIRSYVLRDSTYVDSKQAPFDKFDALQETPLSVDPTASFFRTPSCPHHAVYQFRPYSTHTTNMEDDIAFGASVWGAPDDPIPVAPLAVNPPTFAISPSPSTAPDDFDDFDNFRTPAETTAGSGDEGEDDDFGEFGEFGETQQLPITPGFSTSFGEVTYDEPESIGGPSIPREWKPLHLHPFPSREGLLEQVDNVLGPLWMHDDTSHLTEEAIREVGGLNQTLVTNERYLDPSVYMNYTSEFTDRSSRQLYNALLPPSSPSFQPVNWTRSRIRRQHLIHLGIPVNLDEVLPRTNSALPTLEITTRPMSAPPGPRGGMSKLQTAVVNNSRGGSSIPSSPSSGRGPSAATQLRLGPRPEVNQAKVEELLELSPSTSLNTCIYYTSGILTLTHDK